MGLLVKCSRLQLMLSCIWGSVMWKDTHNTRLWSMEALFGYIINWNTNNPRESLDLVCNHLPTSSQQRGFTRKRGREKWVGFNSHWAMKEKQNKTNLDGYTNAQTHKDAVLWFTVVSSMTQTTELCRFFAPEGGPTTFRFSHSVSFLFFFCFPWMLRV